MPASHIKLYSPSYFYICAIGGIPSCGLTHLLVTPLDLVKCRSQVNNAGAKSSLLSKLKIIGAKEGLVGLYRGGLPTFIGYSAQGACLFGFYEYFKYSFSHLAGQENANKYRTWIYAAASASAEIIGSTVLSPWEALKVRVQTNPSFPNSILPGLTRIIAEEGAFGLTKGLPALWGRQIVYTMAKFASFERTVEATYEYLGKPKNEFNKLQQLGVSFVAGYIAGGIFDLYSYMCCGVTSNGYNGK